MTVIIDVFNGRKRYELTEYESGIFIIEPAYVIPVGRSVLLVLLHNPVNPVWFGKQKEKRPLERRWCRWEVMCERGF